MTGSNPVDRSKLGTKRHILTDKNGIPLSAVITSANKHDIKAVTDVIDNSVINRPSKLSFTKKMTRRQQNRQQQHLCLDRAYNSKSTENEIIRRGYVPHIPYKRKRGQIKKEKTNQKQYSYAKNKRWVVERTNSWHNRFRKLSIRYEKKVENYLGLVQLSCSIIIYRKIILG
jgi:putative transposase